jgi:hypothetical protein
MKYLASFFAMLLLACNNTSYLPLTYGEVPVSFAVTQQGPILYTAQLEIEPNVVKRETLKLRAGKAFADTGVAFVAPDEGTILSASKVSGETFLLYAPEGGNFHLTAIEKRADWDLGKYFSIFSLPKMQAWKFNETMVLSFSEFSSLANVGVPIYRFDVEEGKLIGQSEATAVNCSSLGCFSIVESVGVATVNAVTVSTVPLASTPVAGDIEGQSFTCANPSNGARFVAFTGDTRFAVDVTAPSITSTKVSSSFLALLSKGGTANVECIDEENVLLLQEDGKARIGNLTSGVGSELPVEFEGPSPYNIGAVGYVDENRVLIAYATAGTKEYGCGTAVTCRKKTFKTSIVQYDLKSHSITKIVE